MRADRLISILLLLQTHGRMTARQLAKRLEVSQRTVLRDMDALGAAGVPVVADRGVRGGWSLLNGYRANVTGLNEAEIRALVAAAPPRLLADLHLAEAGDRALLKLASALDPANRRTAEIARQRTHFDPGGWATSSEPVPHLVTLQDAVWSERRVRAIYGDQESERILCPLGLVAKGAVWYVVALAGEGSPRTYRVSRFRDVAPAEETFTRPAGFDLQAYWRDSAARFRSALPRYAVVVRTSRDGLRWLQALIRYGGIDGVTDLEDGTVEVSIHFDAIEVACAVLLGAATAVEVVSPAELRAAIVAAARKVVTRDELRHPTEEAPA